MRFLLILLAALVVAVAVALLAHQDPGYVLIARGGVTVETTLALALTVLVLAFAIMYAAVRSVVGTWRLPRRLRAWRRRRRTARVQRDTRQGLIDLAEGRWARAERKLSHCARHSDNPLINYLGAARAAQKLGAENRRDHYLSLAHHSMPEAKLAVGLTQAEVQLSSGQLEQALATLIALRRTAPKHAQVLYLLKRLYERLESWGDLRDLLPDLKRQKVLKEKELKALEHRVHERLLGIAVESGRADRLKEAWEAIPKELQQDPGLVATYARQLSRVGLGVEAERLLRDVLKRKWNGDLVQIYSTVEGGDPADQLRFAEGLLKERPRHPALLLSLGRLCLRNKLWGKARSYLEASINIAPRPESYRELGTLLEQLGDGEAALEHFRRGVEQAVGSAACTRFRVEDDDPEAAQLRKALSAPAAEAPVNPWRTQRRLNSTAGGQGPGQ